MISIEKLCYRIGERIIFDEASAMIGKGQKVGLVGMNGSGKSTLFRMITGKLAADSGEIKGTENIKTVTQDQEIEDTDISLLDFVLKKDKEITSLQNKIAAETDPAKTAELYEQFNLLGGNSAEARAGSILSGLGFSHDDQGRKLSEFSGGWRVRASLAGTLFQRADLLLLDEPTNHLDLETTIWFADFVKKVNATTVIISHDRNILNDLCDRILSIENLKIESYGGNYDSFIKNKAVKREMLAAEAERYEKRREHLQSFVDRFRYKASKAKQAQARLKMLEKMGDAPEIPKEPSIRFDFPSPEALPPPLLTLSKVDAGYGDKTVLRNLNLRIDFDDRIAVIGANGNGKSTLAKVLNGTIKPGKGEIDGSAKLKIAYFAQHQIEFLDKTKTPFTVINGLMPKAKDSEIMAHLGRFGLGAGKADTLIGNLSGGEKARLQLAVITKDAPHILILDEPTNHLDIMSREALTEALNEYNGAVILITHDMNMIEMTADTLWLVENGGCRPFDGSIEDYKKMIIERNRENERKNAAKNVTIKKEPYKKTKSPPKNTINRIEKELEELTARKNELEERLSREYSNDIQTEYADVCAKIHELEEKWLFLNGA